MNVLAVYPLPGISYAHDANAAVITRSGDLYSSEEERYLRGQHAIGQFPDRAAMLSLRHAALSSRDVDVLATASLERCRRRSDYTARLQYVRELLHLGPGVPALCVPHHLAHTALAVLTSPFEESLFLSLDGGGDGAMGHWGRFRRNRFKIAERCLLSPAIFFSYVTSLCGFPLFEEGKAMGLAAYGRFDDRLGAWFRRSFRIRQGGASLETPLAIQWKSTLDLGRVQAASYARHKFYRWGLDFVGPDSLPSWVDELPAADIARTGQAVFEELLTQILDNIVKRSGQRQIACSGGAFHNVAANGTLATSGAGREFHFPVAPHDAGLALGAALWVRHIHQEPRLQRPLSPYLGLSFSDVEIEQLLRQHLLPFKRMSNICTATARVIAEGKIVGWFQGRAELGARALGARSVLADPRRSDVKARLNQLLKRRDWFMPFAPSILEEHAHEYLEEVSFSPYMNVAYRARPSRAAEIPGALHADLTCRAHIVRQSFQPRYHQLISEFRDLTGIPMVLNTSFNRHGLPMVATPQDAVAEVMAGHVDALAIDDFLVQPADRIGPASKLLPDSAMLKGMSLVRAGRLAAAGRIDAASALLRNADVDVIAGERGFQYANDRVWAYTEPLTALEAWWSRLTTTRSEVTEPILNAASQPPDAIPQRDDS
jgi:carbamoyltransferase